MLGDNLQGGSGVHDGRMTLVESGYFDADIAAPLQQHLDAAYKMFREFCSQRRIQCSQPPFKEKMELWAELAKNNVQKNHGCLGWKVSTAWSWMFLGKFNICIFSAATFYLAPRFSAYVYVSKVGFFWPLVFFFQHPWSIFLWLRWPNQAEKSFGIWRPTMAEWWQSGWPTASRMRRLGHSRMKGCRLHTWQWS